MSGRNRTFEEFNKNRICTRSEWRKDVEEATGILKILGISTKVIHNVMVMLKERINDSTFLNLIEQFIMLSKRGLPLGISFCPILANIYLRPVDDKITGYDYRRYGDNIYTTDKDIEQVLRSELAKLGLEIGKKKKWGVAPKWL